MKKILCSLFLVLAPLLVAQNADETIFPLTTKSSSFGLSALSIVDPYVSPLVYSGFGLRYSTDAKRFFNPANPKISYQLKSSAIVAINLNPAITSSMLYASYEYGVGAHYHLKPMEDVQLLLGGLWDANFGIKNVARNINNPYSLDMATNLNLSAIARYDMYTQKRTYRIQWALQSPFLGAMFVPRGGASYYEIFSLGNSSGTVHLSALHNKRGLRQLISVDVPFRRSTWNFGISSQRLKYTANDLVFVMNETSLVVGTSFDFVRFKGQRHLAPKNFISTNE